LAIYGIKAAYTAGITIGEDWGNHLEFQMAMARVTSYL